ncbi:MAG: hypothetical protein Q8L66_04275 [Caulobacter sp.]|nr:hypothetical protein [Caulobacter sp.]
MTKATLEGADLRYEDRADIVETFADNVQRMTFDGRTLRVEFCVARMDDPDAKAKKRTGRAVPVMRLVLDLDGAVDMFNKMNNLQAALESRGVIKTSPKAAS